MKRPTQLCHQLAGLLGYAAVVTGCSGSKERGELDCRQRAQAVLAAARANHIDMFGDLPNVSEPTYLARAAVSLIRHTWTEVGADFDPDVDAAGKRMVFASTRHNLWPDLYIKSVDGVAVTQLTSDPASDVQPVFSPDGTRVAFASRRSGNWDIWVVSAEGGPPLQITQGMADEVHPSWSPDGTKLVFCSLPSEGGQWELWIANAAAGSTRRFIGYGLFPEWSPVSDMILFQRARERGSRRFSIWTLTLVDQEPRYPTELATSATQAMILPTWSPDETRIAYATAATISAGQDDAATPPSMNEVFDIWVMNADGRGKVRLTDGYTANYAPTFSADGQIFFASSRSGHENIWSLRAVTQPVGSAGDSLLTTSATTGIEGNTRKVARKAASVKDGL